MNHYLRNDNVYVFILNTGERKLANIYEYSGSHTVYIRPITFKTSEQLNDFYNKYIESGFHDITEHELNSKLYESQDYSIWYYKKETWCN